MNRGKSCKESHRGRTEKRKIKNKVIYSVAKRSGKVKTEKQSLTLRNITVNNLTEEDPSRVLWH